MVKARLWEDNSLVVCCEVPLTRVAVLTPLRARPALRMVLEFPRSLREGETNEESILVQVGLRAVLFVLLPLEQWDFGRHIATAGFLGIDDRSRLSPVTTMQSRPRCPGGNEKEKCTSVCAVARENSRLPLSESPWNSLSTGSAVALNQAVSYSEDLFEPRSRSSVF
jgi:hypothetical protein